MTTDLAAAVGGFRDILRRQIVVAIDKLKERSDRNELEEQAWSKNEAAAIRLEATQILFSKDLRALLSEHPVPNPAAVAEERERLWRWRCAVGAATHTGMLPELLESMREIIADIEARLAALPTPPPPSRADVLHTRFELLKVLRTKIDRERCPNDYRNCCDMIDELQAEKARLGAECSQ